MTTFATVDQRERVRRLMERSELDMHRCTSTHTHLAKQAGFDPPEGGTLVDDWINTLTPTQANRLTVTLRERIG